MNLPQCYLADLPPEAEITPTLVQEAWFALLRNHQQHLAAKTTQSIIRDLESAASLWLQDKSPYLQTALKLGSEQLGFSRQTLAEGLKQLFNSITTANLETWIEQDLGHQNRLDDFCVSGPERVCRRRSKAVGATALAHVAAGNVPPAPVMSLIAGLLLRSGQFMKCATGASLIPRLFAHSIHEVNPPLGACMEIAEWPRRRADLLSALIEPAECVTATGSDEAVAKIRNEVPVTKRFVGYPHKVSFAYLAADALETGEPAPSVEMVARDVCAWNQLGCLSPHVIYVEEGGAVRAEDFAERLAAALATLEERNPRGTIPEEEAAAIRSRRGIYEVRAANSRETRMWQSESSTAWTVVYETDALFQASCLNRFVYVKGVANLEAALQGADQVRHHISTVALAGSPARLSQLASRLADWGATRICPIGRMQDPALTWRHDGRPTLSSLVRWTDWEEG